MKKGWIGILCWVVGSSAMAGVTLTRIYQDVVAGSKEEKVFAQQQVQNARAQVTKEKTALRDAKAQHQTLETRIARLERLLVQETEKLQRARRLYQEDKKTMDGIAESLRRHEKLLGDFVQPYGLAPEKETTNLDSSLRLERVDALWHASLEQMVATSAVQQKEKRIFDAQGQRYRTRVTTWGPFVAADSRGKWLQYLPSQKTWQVIAQQPSFSQEVIPVDPTLGKILPTWVEKNSFWTKVAPAGMIGVLIVLVALVGFGIAGVRWWWLTQRKARIEKQKENLLVLRDDNALGRLHLAVRDGDTDQELDARLEAALVREGPLFEKGIGTIAVFAGIPTLLGLLGTVSGMIETFTVMGQSGNQNANLLAGGIAEALLTTEFGLLAAIPMLLVHCAVKNRARSLLEMLEEQASQLAARHSSCGCCGSCH